MFRYAITDRLRLGADEPARHAALLLQAAHLASQGVDLLQLREKDLPSAAVADLARNLLETIRANAGSAQPRTKLLINSRADIAIATRADGVHLTSAPGSLTPAHVRNLYAAANLAGPIVSISCHTLDEVTRACDAAANLILFGPVVGKRVGTQLIGPGIGLDSLHAACLAAGPLPVLALGGITATDIPACRAAGAAGIAGIRVFSRPPASPSCFLASV